MFWIMGDLTWIKGFVFGYRCGQGAREKKGCIIVWCVMFGDGV